VYLCEIRTGKTERGIRQRGRREIESIGLKWFWRGLKMTFEEKEHLSIFSNTNQ